MVKVEILYVENCPHYTKACSIICDIIAELDLDAEISIKKVSEKSKFDNFRGSPTVLIDGIDAELCFNEVNELENTSDLIHSIACRLYNCQNGIGCPSHEMIRCTIEKTLN